MLPLHTVQSGKCSCGKGECTSPAKHPRIKGWQTDASTNPEQIRKWWQKWPNANIGIATGAESGLFVVDVDGEAGRSSVQELIDEQDWQPDTLTATTGKGSHLYFQHPGFPVKTNAAQIGVGIDVRGEGGYVVAPSSLHANGSIYGWMDSEQAVAEAPEWLLDLIRPEGHTQGTVISPVADRVIREGTRNDTLYGIGCGLRGSGYELEEIEEELMKVNDEKCDPPLAECEVRETAKSAAKHPAGRQPNRSEANPFWWFKFDVHQWRGDTNVLCMKDRQVGWYVWLMAECWMNGGFLPSEPKKLAKLARATSEKTFLNEMNAVLVAFEPTEDETQIFHPKLRRLWEENCVTAERNSQSGKKSAALRAQKNAVQSGVKMAA